MADYKQRSWPQASLLYSLDEARHSNPESSSFVASTYFPTKPQTRTQERWLLSPDSRLRAVLEVVGGLVVLSHIVAIPLFLTYEPAEILDQSDFIYWSELYFLLDIAIKFNTARYNDGALVSDRLGIAKYYFRKGKLVQDLLAILPLWLVIEPMRFSRKYFSDLVVDSNVFFKLLWLLKLCRAYKVKQLFDQFQDVSTGSVSVTLIQGLKFIFIAAIAAHWLACLRHASLVFGLKDTGDLWTDMQSSSADRYLTDFYFVIVTMTSVGYGEISPVTSTERVVSIVSMISACGLFGFLLGSFESLMAKYNAESGYYKSVLLQLKHYMKKIRLNKETRFKVIRYIHYLKEAQANSDTNEAEVLGALSVPLREEIFSATRGSLISQSAVFAHYCSDFLKYIGKVMKVEVYSPNDIICSEGQRSQKLFFIQTGTVEVFHDKSKTIFKVLGKGRSFGEIGFFLETHRTASVRCQYFSELLAIRRYTLNSILETRPKEKQITDLIIRKANETDLSVLGIRCFLCKQMGHVARDCSDFKFSLNLAQLLRKADLRKFQARKSIDLKTPDFDIVPRKKKQVVPLDSLAYRNVIGDPRNTMFERDSLNQKVQEYQQAKQLRKVREANRQDNLAHIDEVSEDSEELGECPSPLPIAFQFTRQFRHSKTLRDTNLLDLDSPEIYQLSPDSSPVKLFPIKSYKTETEDYFTFDHR